MKPEIITKEHKHFKKLMSRLNSNLEKCRCHHDFRNLRVACNELEKWMEIKVDFKETMKYLESKGGYCDCEIMLNVS